MTIIRLFIFFYGLLAGLFIALVLSGLVWIPAYRIHRRRVAKGQIIGPVGKLVYLAPAAAWLCLPFYPSSPTPITLLSVAFISSLQWALVLAALVLVGLKYYKRGLGLERQSMWQWVNSWPGIAGPEPLPAGLNQSEKVVHPVLALPVVATFVSLGDVLGKLFGHFEYLQLTSLLQFSLVVTALGAGFHVLTAGATEPGILGDMRLVARYPKRVRVTTVAAVSLMLVVWALAASTEPKASLAIAAATIPSPSERQVSLTLVNHGNNVRILQGFEVESRTWTIFGCRSADFEIPLAGQYNLKFHVRDVLTEIPAVPRLQFQYNKPGTVLVVLEPNATGACADPWEAYIRIAIVADDGGRSWTEWFQVIPSETSSKPGFLRRP